MKKYQEIKVGFTSFDSQQMSSKDALHKSNLIFKSVSSNGLGFR